MDRFTLWLLLTLMGTCLPVHATDRAIGVQGIVPPEIRASEGFDSTESAGLFVGIRTFKDEGFAEVPLLGTTRGGYSYDDYELKNGVFTASILDGLRGQAPTDQRHFITVRTLSDYIDHWVRHWVREHRPEHATISTGISRRFEGPAATMPLAIDLSAMPALAAKSSQERYEAALQKLYANVDFRGPITGSLADEVTQVLLSSDLAADWREALLSELETLDGSLRGKRIFADSYHQRRHWFGLGNGVQQSHQKTSDPLPSPSIPQGEVTIAKSPSQPATYTLTVRAHPPDSRIRVMNIRPSYQPEMSLPPGEYDILVDHQGYNPARQWVTIRDQDVVIDMRLDPR